MLKYRIPITILETRKSRLIPDYSFNPDLGSTGRYINKATGRAVSANTIANQTNRVIEGVRQEMIDISRQLQRGEITSQQWYWMVRDKVRVAHSLSAIVVSGGFDAMTAAKWGKVGGLTKFHYNKLNNLAKEINEGLPLNGHFLQRTGMYAEAARSTGEEVKRAKSESNGSTEEARILGQADHCTTRKGVLGCVELAAKGYQPINTLPRIGQTPCLTRCKCHFVYR